MLGCHLKKDIYDDKKDGFISIYLMMEIKYYYKNYTFISLILFKCSFDKAISFNSFSRLLRYSSDSS